MLYYRITNLSNQIFTLDESKLNVRMLNSPVGTNSDRVTQLTPGQTAYGTITLDDARLHTTSAMTIEWAARDTDTSRATYMRTMISVKRAPLPNWSNAQHAAVRVAHSGPVIAAGRANTE